MCKFMELKIMRTINIKIYKYEELDPQSQRNALSRHSAGVDFYGSGEAADSMKKLAMHFGVDRAYFVDCDHPASSACMSYMRDAPDMDYGDMLALLGKLGKFDEETMRGHGDCVLTGVCYDEFAIDGFRKEFFNGAAAPTLEKCLLAAWTSLLKVCQDEMEYNQGEEAFKEECSGEGQEFYDDGRCYYDRHSGGEESSD